MSQAHAQIDEGLVSWGWNESWLDALRKASFELERTFDFTEGFRARRIGRVTGGAHEVFRVAVTRDEAWLAKPLGRLRESDRWPAVGDWVVVEAPASGTADPVIVGVLERRTALRRKRAGKSSQAQILASNVDRVFIVCNPNEDFSLGRVDRYVALAFDGGAAPVIVLNKADLAADVDLWLAQLRAQHPSLELVSVSARTGLGCEAFERLLPRGLTGVFVGSSGVGKSSLLNRLLGRAIAQTSDIREGDDKGRHTTTSRELHVVTWGGLVIDSPGLREVALVGGEGVSLAFGDIEALAARCRFTDCRHADEPGCAIRQALDKGELSERRLRSYLALEKEAAWARSREEEFRAEAQQRKRHSKVLAKGLRAQLKQKGRS